MVSEELGTCGCKSSVNCFSINGRPVAPTVSGSSDGFGECANYSNKSIWLAHTDTPKIVSCSQTPFWTILRVEWGLARWARLHTGVVPSLFRRVGTSLKIWAFHSSIELSIPSLVVLSKHAKCLRSGAAPLKRLTYFYPLIFQSCSMKGLLVCVEVWEQS